MDETGNAWNDVGDRFATFGRLLKERFGQEEGPDAEAVKDAFASLGEAVERLGERVGDVARDPDVRDNARQVAQSIGQAVSATFAPTRAKDETEHPDEAGQDGTVPPD